MNSYSNFPIYNQFHTNILVLGIIAVVISFLLPIESKGLDLSETGHQMTKGRTYLVNEKEDDDHHGTLGVTSSSGQIAKERF